MSSLANPLIETPEPQEQVLAPRELERRIRHLKESLDAVILAHYYQEDDIQDLADFVGDSLELSRKGAAAKAKTIVFCGVHFMGETVKILSPDKLVLVPDLDAGCSLADRCPPEAFARWLGEYPDHTVVTYINSSATVKAMSDVICTSSNAVQIVNRLPKDRPIIFAPDRHLARWVSKQTGRGLVAWPGFCIVHEQFSHRRIVQLRVRHPDAQVVAHPECEEAVLAQADFIGSTSALLKFVTESAGRVFIVATEAGILHAMHRRRPEAHFIAAPPNSGCDCALCPYMRLNTMEKLYECMRDQRPTVTIDADIARRARRAIDRMMEMSVP